MALEAIERDFKARVSDRLSLQMAGAHRFRVLTPFRFEDGDHLSIVLRREDDSWVLSDEGNTYMHLSYRMDESALFSGTRQKVIADTLSMFGVDDREGELLAPVGDDAGGALYGFVQALLRISDVSLLSRERVTATFVEDFKRFLTEEVPESRRTFGWHHPQRDPSASYPADCYVNSSARPTVIFALYSDTKVREATISLLKYEQWGLGMQSLGIFEEQVKIGRRPLAQFTDVCDRQFSSLAGETKERVRDFLARRVLTSS